MQVDKFKKSNKSLSQGTVFKFEKLIFTNPKSKKSKKLKFSDMYPEANMQGVGFGIVLSQSCDLVNEGGRTISTPYITIAMLDPIERYFEEFYQDKMQKTVVDNSLDFKIGEESRRFINEETVTLKMLNDAKTLFQNNEKFYFFISLKDKTKEELFSVNLTKVFPIKSMHCEQILKKSVFQLKPFFENKLGWKLAEVYGRVGTPDYSDAELKRLSKLLLDKVSAKIKFGEGIQIGKDDFTQLKALQNARKEKKEEYFKNLIQKISNQ